MGSVICNILVVVFVNSDNIRVLTKADVEGSIVSKNQINYLVDFSREAKQKGYEGDYSKVLVKREDCVEE